MILFALNYCRDIERENNNSIRLPMNNEGMYRLRRSMRGMRRDERRKKKNPTNIFRVGRARVALPADNYGSADPR